MSARQLALITGASSGIGATFARELAGRGYDLVLAARRADRLSSLSAELSSRHGVACSWVQVDLSRPDGAADLVSRTDQLGSPVDMLINNAGFGSYGHFSSLPLERELEMMIDLNVRALVSLTGRFLPRMVERGRGQIIQIASTTSFQPVPFMATYGASKAFVLHFGEAIAREVQATGVRVLTVCPGHTPTEFQENSGVQQRPMRTSKQSADDVVREALHALERGDHVIVTGWPNRITTRLPRLVPRRVLTWAVGRGFQPRH